MTIYKLPDGHEYPEYTKFARYNTGLVEWIPLLIGENRVRFYALCNLVEVRQPFMTDMLYDQPQPCRAITIWRPTLVLSPELAANINHSANVEIVVRPAHAA